MTTISYDPMWGRLDLDEALLRQLDWPHDLALQVSAGGLVLSTELNTGTLIAPVSYYGLHDEEQTISLALPATLAEQLGVQAGTYAAWVDRERGELYALWGELETAAALRPVSIELMASEVCALEALALRHGVRMRDILTAFAADLAAAQARDPAQRSSGRSGGSDERLFAAEWFGRNRDASGPRPQFVRSFPPEEEGLR